MTIEELFSAGKLQESIQALGAKLRDRPTDVKLRTFLFELLCFAGEYSRAEKQLNVLADASKEAQTGALLYRSALSAEKKRQLFFESRQYTSAETSLNPILAGSLNGEPFETLEDVDPRIGPRLEVFLAGEYVWMPFSSIGSVAINPPTMLRDTLWASGVMMGSAALKGSDFGEVLLPVLCPLSWKNTSDQVRLGRETVSGLDEDQQEVPFGQKLLLLDNERTVPFLEIRSLVFNDPEAPDDSDVSVSP